MGNGVVGVGYRVDRVGGGSEKGGLGRGDG